MPPVAITGSAAGIGLAIATRFAGAGYPVAVIDLNREDAEKVAAQLADTYDVSTCGVAADVTNAAACAEAHTTIEETLGPIGVLINNAGIMPQQKGWIEQLPPEQFDTMLQVHLGGSVTWSRLVLPNMRRAQYGRIINMTSVNAILAVPHRLGYVTAKKAILGFTEGLALDCARAGITVNAIAPGYVLTDTLKERADRGMIDHDALAERVPVGRWGRPEDIARAALYLADKESGFVTGTTLVVDGGLTIRGDPGEDIDHSPYVST